eukprot:763560-Hanusia_phi.AAC.4
MPFGDFYCCWQQQARSEQSHRGYRHPREYLHLTLSVQLPPPRCAYPPQPRTDLFDHPSRTCKVLASRPALDPKRRSCSYASS